MYFTNFHVILLIIFNLKLYVVICYNVVFAIVLNTDDALWGVMIVYEHRILRQAEYKHFDINILIYFVNYRLVLEYDSCIDKITFKTAGILY